MTFEILEIKPEIIRALKEDGINSPTKIQTLTIPMIKSGKDVIGTSETGSGKTAAFGIPILEKVIPGRGLQILILTPTRELAVQISKVLRKFAKYIRCSIATVYGGVALGPQINSMAKADVVVGTTGRLVDHLQRRNLDLSRLTCVVLDEADKMVEMGFIEDIELIMSKVPKNRQILLFGATISDEIDNLKNKHMNEPVFAKAEAYVKEDFLKQYYYDVLPHEKFSLLVHLLKKEKTERVIIFCSTRVTVEILTRNLKAQGIKVEMLHGKLGQSMRLRIVENFNRGNPKILVASAVSARGLDIRDVSHIFNYGLSSDPQEYIHRVGRTARAGESGKAITLLEPRDHDAFGQILRRFSQNIKRLPDERFPRLIFQARQSSQRRYDNRGGGPRRNGFSRGRRMGPRRDNRDLRNPRYGSSTLRRPNRSDIPKHLEY